MSAVNGLDLAFDEQGSGPPLVILHGLFGSARNWQSVARQLAPEYRVIAADLRNHGRSPHAPSMNYRALTDDVCRLCDRLDLGAVTLLGHSMGGKVAMTLALMAPVRVARLVVVDIAPTATADIHTQLIDTLLALPLGDIKRRVDAEQRLATAVPDRELRLFLLQNLQPGPDGSRWRVNLPALRQEMATLVAALPVDGRYPGPAHFIRGARSDRITEAEWPAIRALFPRCRLHTVENGGHWPHAEAPEAFMRALREALAAD